MRAKSVMIVACVAVVLWVVAALLSRGGPCQGTGVVVGARVVGVSPSAVMSLTVRDAAGSEARIWRHESGAWLHEADGLVWTADETRVRAGLRVVCDALVRGGADDDLDGGVTVELGLVEGGSIMMRVDAVAIGGRTRVVVDGGPGVLVDERVGRVLEIDGVLAWRSEEAVPLLDARVRRVLSGEVVVSRVGDRWGLESPVVARAREAGVLTWLGSLQAGVGSGRSDVEIVGGADGAVERWMVGVEEDGVVSEAVLRDGVVLGPREFLGRGVPALEPGAVVALRAVGSGEALVSRVVVGGRTATRGEDGWDAAWAGELLEVLAGVDAEEVAIGVRPAGVDFELVGFGGVALESGVIAFDAARWDGAVWVDGVLWRYSERAAEMLGSVVGGLAGDGG